MEDSEIRVGPLYLVKRGDKKVWVRVIQTRERPGHRQFHVRDGSTGYEWSAEAEDFISEVKITIGPVTYGPAVPQEPYDYEQQQKRFQ